MEFKEILRDLRLRSNLTQEQLAEKLFVSRVTVSKWETGRGYPNLDSLKLISKIFSVSIDDLLSTEQLIEISDSNTKKQRSQLCSIFFGCIDFLVGILLFLPIFVDKDVSDIVVVNSLLSVSFSNPIIRLNLISFISIFSFFGVIELVLQTLQCQFWIKIKFYLSFGFSFICEILLIFTNQQYPAFLILFFSVIKIYIFLKLRKVSLM